MRRPWRCALLAIALPIALGACGSTPSGGETGPPTWHRDVAPVVSHNCTGCHRPGGIAPFALTTYAAAKPLAGAMASAVDTGSMPPWHAVETDECKPRLPWKHDLRLSAQDKGLISRWAAAGALEGDASRAAPLRAPAASDLANPTLRLTMSKPYVVPSARDTRDVFRCFPLPHTFEQDTWLTGLQVVPGNGKVVHHVLVWLDRDRNGGKLAGDQGSYECFGAPGFESILLGAWVPGATPIDLPPGVGLPAPRGSQIVVNVHYHPTGAEEADTSSLDLRFTTTKPPLDALLALLGNARVAKDGLLPGPNDPAGGPEFLIPPGARNHVENMAITLPDALLLPVRLFLVGTHMHYVGTDMKIDVDRSARLGGAPADEPGRECLLQTPRWDFNWQRGYAFDAAIRKLPTVGARDVITLRCKYDNSLANPHVADALREQGVATPREVRLGEQTLDEMCLGILGIAFPGRL